jgi:hypothetical protein
VTGPVELGVEPAPRRRRDFHQLCVVLRRGPGTGDRGQTVDEGWLRPFLLIWAAYLVVVAVVFSAGRVARRPYRNADPED